MQLAPLRNDRMVVSLFSAALTEGLALKGSTN